MRKRLLLIFALAIPAVAQTITLYPNTPAYNFQVLPGSASGDGLANGTALRLHRTLS
jgi:hypothetical protein